MLYYLINPEKLSIISGPHNQSSNEIKKITRCGNPEFINLLDYNIVPEIKPDIEENQKFGEAIVLKDKVTYDVINKTAEEIDEEIQQKLTIKRSNLNCTPRQFRLVLAKQNLLPSIQSFIDQQDELTRIEWEYANDIARTHPTIVASAINLGFTEEQIDDLFELAMTL